MFKQRAATEMAGIQEQQQQQQSEAEAGGLAVGNGGQGAGSGNHCLYQQDPSAVFVKTEYDQGKKNIC